jgi:acyl dehydratase
MNAPRGRYYEDFTVGEEIATPARTVTSTDIVNFACISGDFNEIAGGLWHAAGVNDGTILALLGVDEWRLVGPVRHGDTIHMVARVAEKKETSKPDRGVVVFDRRIVKQDGAVVQTMRTTLMYRRRPVN